MSKLQEIATAAPAAVKALEARADKLAGRLSALAKRGDDVFSKWDAHLDEQDTAITAAENAINQLSNAPLPGSEQPFRAPGAGNGAEHE